VSVVHHFVDFDHSLQRRDPHVIDPGYRFPIDFVTKIMPDRWNKTPFHRGPQMGILHRQDLAGSKSAHTCLRYPAFAGFDPERFLEPNKVKNDNNNFGPFFGLASSPSFRSDWRRKRCNDANLHSLQRPEAHNSQRKFSISMMSLPLWSIDA
jgi:hypothetical protein